MTTSDRGKGPGAAKRVVIAGGSGFLGVSLSFHLASAGWNVTILSRTAPKVSGPWSHLAWDGRSLGSWAAAINGADVLVNLAGRTVDCIKTPDHCDEILRSRVESTTVLGAACRAADHPPAVWVQMATAHIYGDPPVVRCDESSPFGYGLAPTVGKAWEAAFAAAALPSQRQVTLRTSFVLGRDRGAGGGALSTLARLAKLGLGGTVGSGTQGMSWIHELDMNRIFEQAMTDDRMSGAYIASAPHPVDNRSFMKELRAATPWPKVPLGLPAFEWMVRIGAATVLQTDPELALYGRYVLPARLHQEGFEFKFPRLPEALMDLLGGNAAAATR